MKTTRFLALALSAGVGIYGITACSDDDTDVNPTPDASTTNDSGSDTSNNVTADSSSNDDASNDAGPQTQAVTITFKAKFGTQDFACGTTYEGQGTPPTPVEPADLRFYVSEVKLLDAQGNAVPVTLDTRSPWQTPDVALLDFEDATGGCSNGTLEKNDKITGTVPAGTYTGIVFTNGVPATLNHGDPVTAPPPLNLPNLSWSWLSGRLFIKAEVTGQDGGAGIFHLGSTGCTNAPDGGSNTPTQAPTMPCAKPNRNEVRLTGFNPATNAVVLDVKTLFQGADLTIESTCHSFMGPACPTTFPNVGVDYATGAKLTTHPAFRVE